MEISNNYRRLHHLPLQRKRKKGQVISLAGVGMSLGLPDPLPGRGKVHSGGCVESSWMVKGRIPG